VPVKVAGALLFSALLVLAIGLCMLGTWVVWSVFAMLVQMR
jgi:hypothetical protein